ncbi:hypothetical protein ASG56_09855 [Rhodococcus sp. Leaf7]|uniref:GNAT family N-acetyltransferase n=1 Tax=unclassified Rhodococcus (in: high G+C Gram-positive bacteria) TaxID=192944 RepID=UPI0005ABE6CD|nr:MULTISPECIES: GNAT family N-acetyltransferase [unclassified Rhodococcus (in: high G+C Gram-positive bacteria)]KIQ15097.1 hypothetical protein RU01_16040 [Rhodococcus sp. MEB064]KQU03767.1 hypothetical protein ASG56_09855 [Rhodococcus sp. Leaf7]KQU39953.1 hypothetical protein ASG64_09850 [Rhodococcus sp. Leaf247]
MASDKDTPRVEHHPERQRFEILIGDEVAGFAEYRQSSPTVRDFDHTVTDPKFRGRGLAAILVGHALDDTRAAGSTVVASCSYVHHFIETHEQYADLVT